jgi:hypothetical protein
MITCLSSSGFISMEVMEKIGFIILAISMLISNAYYKQWRFEKRFEEMYGFKYKNRKR